MSTFPGFWEGGPHDDPIPVEESWREFVRQVEGTVLNDVLPKHRQFENADFAFFEAEVIAELKEIETEFSEFASFREGFDTLMRRLLNGPRLVACSLGWHRKVVGLVRA